MASTYRIWGIVSLALSLEAGAIEDADSVDFVRPKSLLFETPTNQYFEADTSSAPTPSAKREDTLELSEKKVAPNGCDSLCTEFRKYWAKVEEREGYGALKKQIHAQDVDSTWIPHFYLFDSNVVVFPWWIVIRNKNWW